MRSRIPGLDGVRGIAIALVLLFHADQSVGFFRGGAYGVTVFFTLSGFLITGILLGKPRLRDFYVRRAVRLLPPLGLFLGAAAIVGTAWSDIWPGLFYVASYVQPARDMGAMAHMWSLSVEEHFYLVWPLIVLKSKNPDRWVTGLLAAAVAWRVYLTFTAPAPWVYHPSDANAYALLAGCWLAVRHHRKPLQPSRWDILALAPVIGLSMGAVFLTPTFLWGSFVVVACTMLLIRAGLGSQPILEAGWVRWLGVVSYGVYLWHPLTFRWFGELGGAVAAVVLASALWVWVEKPMLDWQRRHLRVTSVVARNAGGPVMPTTL